VTDTHDLTKRNADFAASAFTADLRINPYGNMMVIGCVDPRVDPGTVLGLANGEAAVLRNVGGRITPATLRTMAMLTKVSQANQKSVPAGTWNLVILHHTDCGMTDLASYPDLLAEYFEIPADELAASRSAIRSARYESTPTSSWPAPGVPQPWFPAWSTTSPPGW
jgi:carbonic anhydrase